MALTLVNTHTSDTMAAAGQRDSGVARSVTFTPTVGEILVIKYITENWGGTLSVNPTATGLTVTSRVPKTGGTQCAAAWLWTTNATTTTSSVTVSLTGPTAGNDRAQLLVVERWSGAQIAASPVTFAGFQGATTSAGGTAPLVTATTAGTGSVISSIFGDSNTQEANSYASPVYRSSATQDALISKAGTYYLSAASVYQTAASPGSQDVGMTSPANQGWGLAGIEIQDAGGGATALAPTVRNFTQAAVVRSTRW